MTMKNLIATIAEQNNISKAQSRRIINTAVDFINSTCTTGKIRISNLGTFKTKIKNARVCRNPNTGESINVPKKSVLVFKASKSNVAILDE